MSIIQRLVNKIEILLANRTNKGKILYLKKKVHVLVKILYLIVPFRLLVQNHI